MKYRFLLKKINTRINKIINNIKFRIEAFSFGKIVILAGVIIGTISLFLNHINSSNILLKANVFGKITIFSGILESIFLFIIFFLLFSLNKKEFIKKQINILFRDYIIIAFLAIFILILGINNYFIIKGLTLFSSEIIFGNGIIMQIISSIIILAGAFILKNEYQNNKGFFINDTETTSNINNEKNHTKLPF